ncbi:MAG: ExbD/TolR family protein [Planctomycetaceae bacterium]
MSAPSSEGADPDLTPLLDMVFQLITFFMLVINFKGAALDQTLQLPVLGSARPLEWQGEYEPLVLNIDKDGRIKVYEQPVDPEKYIASEATELKKQLQAAGQPTTGELPVPVVMRADKGTKFHLVNRIIQLCQENGYQQFSLSAMTGKGE